VNSSKDIPKPCAGGCGFFGDVELDMYCSVCFKTTRGEKKFMRRTEKDQTEPFLSVEQREREREKERKQQRKMVETNPLIAQVESLVLEVCSLALPHSLAPSPPYPPSFGPFFCQS